MGFNSEFKELNKQTPRKGNMFKVTLRYIDGKQIKHFTLKRILWSKDIRKERKLNIYNVLLKSSLLYGSETWRLTENNKRRVEAT